MNSEKSAQFVPCTMQPCDAGARYAYFKMRALDTESVYVVIVSAGSMGTACRLSVVHIAATEHQ